MPEGHDHAGTDDEAGLVRAADLIGQLADPLYLRRAGALYQEMVETGIAAQLGYSSPADLIEQYPQFYWTRVEPYIGDALRCLRRTMTGQGVDRAPVRQRVHGRAPAPRPGPRAGAQPGAQGAVAQRMLICLAPQMPASCDCAIVCRAK